MRNGFRIETGDRHGRAVRRSHRRSRNWLRALDQMSAARARKGDVGGLEAGSLPDALREIVERPVPIREVCGRCDAVLHDGREVKGSVGGCKALGAHPEDEPQCARFLFERRQAAVERGETVVGHEGASRSGPTLDASTEGAPQ